jgi:hypothetical protein
MNHVISDHVSFGSQLQYVPQAEFAQTAPAMMPTVRNRKPNEIVLAVAASSASVKSAGHCCRFATRSDSKRLPQRRTANAP